MYLCHVETIKRETLYDKLHTERRESDRESQSERLKVIGAEVGNPMCKKCDGKTFVSKKKSQNYIY